MSDLPTTPRGAPGLAAAAASPHPVYFAVPAAVLLAAASFGMLRGAEPFVSFFYIFAWYPTIVLLDCAIAARTGHFYLLGRPRFALSLLGWSAVLWFLFEVVNFRVQNWYYVLLPPELPIRWIGTTVSFATVLPAILLAEKWLESSGAFMKDRWPTFEVTDGLLRGLFWLGLIFAVLSLAWPTQFFPLIWGALTLILEPWNYRRDKRRSLIGDLAAGVPGRLLRLLVAGLTIGFIWEMYNIEARAKWVYTVPGFEDLKLFEMPLLGFVGFPVFALDCFVVYQSVVLAGVAVSEEPKRDVLGIRPARALITAAAAALFCVAALLGMDRWNIDSFVPQLKNFSLLEPEGRAQLTDTPYENLFVLAKSSPQEIVNATGASRAAAQHWIDVAQLATFRGLGTENARLLWKLGIRSLDDLAAADPDRLGRELRDNAVRPRTATSKKLHVWIAAARRASSSR